MVNICFAQGFLEFDMVPGMVQDGSDMVPKRSDLTNARYLQGFAMVPGMVRDGADIVPQRLGVRIRRQSFLFVRWRLCLRAAHTN